MFLKRLREAILKGSVRRHFPTCAPFLFFYPLRPAQIMIIVNSAKCRIATYPLKSGIAAIER
jgi:hypothetical protein